MRLNPLEPEEAFFSRVREAKTMLEIATELGVSKTALYCWLDAGEGRRDALDKARKAAASELAEQAGQVLDELVDDEDLTAPKVQLATQRSGFKRWLAGKWDDRFSDRPAGVQVNIGIGELHLDALRVRGSLPDPVGPVVEAEIDEAEMYEAEIDEE